MKTKNLLLICIFCLLSVNLTYARWPQVDPHAENYFDQSPYAFAGGNPVNNVDPNGRDWYSYQEVYTGEDGNEQTRTQYVYKDAPLSKKEMQAQGLAWVGITGKTKDGSQYLSLFGNRLDTKTTEGKSNLTTEAIANLDKAIINSYKADYYNAPGNRDPLSSEYYSAATNMGLSVNITSENVRDRRNIFNTNYTGGNVKYFASNSHNGWSFDWGTGDVKRQSGYIYDVGTGATAKVSRGREVVVLWIFPTTSVWQNTRNKANKLLLDRKW